MEFLIIRQHRGSGLISKVSETHLVKCEHFAACSESGTERWAIVRNRSDGLTTTDSTLRSCVRDHCAHFRAASGVGNRGCVRVVESRSAVPAGGSLSRAADPLLPLSDAAFRASFWRPPRLVAPRRICSPSPAP